MHVCAIANTGTGYKYRERVRRVHEAVHVGMQRQRGRQESGLSMSHKRHEVIREAKRKGRQRLAILVSGLAIL